MLTSKTIKESNPEYNQFMQIALEEAKISLREGNNGFGAVIAKDDTLIVRAHDTEETDSDPTSHAELNAIRMASQKLGRNLEGCVLIATHEPCPMCATAVIWSGIKILVYGYSITEAIAEGRRRINLTCKELFERAQSDIQVFEGVMHHQCSVLYRKDVRDEVKKLRGVTPKGLESLKNILCEKRIAWYQKNHGNLGFSDSNSVLNGYELLLIKLGIEPEEAPIVIKTDKRIVFHSQNFCPTLEACKILDLDTRIVCKSINEEPTDALVKQLNDKLEFRRNYDRLRPYSDYCEEMVFLAEKE